MIAALIVAYVIFMAFVFSAFIVGGREDDRMRERGE